MLEITKSATEKIAEYLNCGIDFEEGCSACPTSSACS